MILAASLGGVFLAFLTKQGNLEPNAEEVAPSPVVHPASERPKQFPGGPTSEGALVEENRGEGTGTADLRNPREVQPLETEEVFPRREEIVEFAEPIRRYIDTFEGREEEITVSFPVSLMGQDYNILLDSFRRVDSEGDAGAFFGKVEGVEPSTVAWGFFEDAESAEIHLRGDTTLKIQYAGEGRLHRVTEWDSADIGVHTHSLPANLSR